jgi:hypothetical protein
VSGFVVERTYLVGDSVWHPEVQRAIDRHRPAVAIVNAGAASFVNGPLITMGVDDVAAVSERVPTTIAVHMEAINHCALTRAELAAALPGVVIPADGESYETAL